MPTRSPRFWLEILLLGFLFTAGMILLSGALDQPWKSLARILYVAVIFGGYGRYYERTWNQKTGR